MNKEKIVSLPVYLGPQQEQLSKFDAAQRLLDDWHGCEKCELCQTRSSESIVFASGNPESKIMIIGEAPGEQEAKTGIPFIGASGQLMNEFIATSSDDPGIQELGRWFLKGKALTPSDGIYFHEQMLAYRERVFMLSNIVSCRPPDNEKPTPAQQDACWPRLLSLIYLIDPWLIITVGNTPLEKLSRQKLKVTKVHGQIFDCEFTTRFGKTSYPVLPTLHPSYLLRRADWKDPKGEYWATSNDWLSAMRVFDQLRLNHRLISKLPKRGLE
jgi:uracil-DNA glycosylase family 4